MAYRLTFSITKISHAAAISSRPRGQCGSFSGHWWLYNGDSGPCVPVPKGGNYPRVQLSAWMRMVFTILLLLSSFWRGFWGYLLGECQMEVGRGGGRTIDGAFLCGQENVLMLPSSFPALLVPHGWVLVLLGPVQPPVSSPA